MIQRWSGRRWVGHAISGSSIALGMCLVSWPDQPVWWVAVTLINLGTSLGDTILTEG